MEKQALNLPSPGSWFQDVFGILIIVLASLIIAGVVVWWFLAKNSAAKGSRKRKRKRNSHRRKANPTLAQTGGLPPTRDPEAPMKPRL